ncbi:hypothetical protein FB567DRAFT_519937 [Paraphoma chrysanthemicola]|uniref:Rhodopsin domain-containing protein n=1 Tax=Paraphoma chrysanthemicola TaxID=798071 RepID=A0A8K0RDS1_9PLEO|nr:hypothetical protein FB567DRAFT_519937 [Paraphoma chrysanthemicola]
MPGSMDFSQIDPSTMDMTKIPAAIPPPGVIPNFINPASRAHGSIVTCALLTAFMLVFLVLRMNTKIFILKQVGWDDFFCVLGALLAIGYVGLIIFVFDAGLGSHQWDTPISVFLKPDTFNSLQAIYDLHGVTISCTKIAILCLYLRLFGVYRYLRIMVYFGILTTVLVHGVATIAAMALCTTESALEYVKCSGTTTTIALVASAINVVSDLYILAIPCLAVWNLHMDVKRKLGVLAVFSAGLLACGAGIAGLVLRIMQRSHLNDVSWWVSPLFICTVLEINIGLIVCCMPILPRLMKSVKESSSYAYARTLVRSRRSGSSAKSVGSSNQNDAPSEKNDSKEQLTGQVTVRTTIAVDSQV